MEAVVGFQTGHSCLGRHCMERWEVTSHTRRRKWIILCSRLAPPRLKLATVSFYNSITAVNRCFGVVPHHHSTVAISTFACLVAHIRSTDMISARTVARIDIYNHQGCPCTRREIFISQGSRGPRCEWSFDLLLSRAFCRHSSSNQLGGMHLSRAPWANHVKLCLLDGHKWCCA